MSLAAAVVREFKMLSPDRLLGFHERWLRGTFAPGIDTSALSVPRGNAKSATCGRLVALCMTPGSCLWRPGLETVVVAGSLAQARRTWGFARQVLGEDLYSWRDSDQRIGVTHKATGQVAYVISSNAKKALGLSQFGLIIGDEPGSWEAREGEFMYDALRESIGKLPDQRVLLVGTRAPAEPGSWWLSLLDGGSRPDLGVHVSALSASPEEAWDAWQTIRRVNPVVNAHQPLRQTKLRRRDEARGDPQKIRKFQAWHLNMSVETVDEMLVEGVDWLAVEGRHVPPREGRPFVGLDMGGERAWTAAWCVWRNGRSECYAVMPGEPGVEEREKKDAQPRGTYARLLQDRSLIIEPRLEYSEPATLLRWLDDLGIRPVRATCDRFLLKRLRGAVAGRFPLEPRTDQWSTSTEAITSFRRLVADGPLSIAPECRGLARVALGEAVVIGDRKGNLTLAKRRHDRSRDDVAVCGTFAAAILCDHLDRPRRKQDYWSITVA